METYTKILETKGYNANRLLASVFAGHFWYYIMPEDGSIEVCRLDYQDCEWANKDPKDFFQYHKPIPCNGSTVKAFGIEMKEFCGDHAIYHFSDLSRMIEFTEDSNGFWYYADGTGHNIEWIHQLQMLFHGMEGEPIEPIDIEKMNHQKIVDELKDGTPMGDDLPF